MGMTLDMFGLDLSGMWQQAREQQQNSVTVELPSPPEPCESRRPSNLPSQRKLSSGLSMVPRKEPIMGVRWSVV